MPTIISGLKFRSIIQDFVKLRFKKIQKKQSFRGLGYGESQRYLRLCPGENAQEFKFTSLKE